MKITQSLLWADWRSLLQADDLDQIKQILRGTYLAMGVTPMPDLLHINASDLVHEGHAPEDVLRACRAWRLGHVPEHKTRRPPLAGDLHNWLRPEAHVTDRADVGMQSIMGAMARYGYMQGEAAAKALGETVWSVVNRLGGWSTLCAATPEGCTTTKAQLKKSLESAYKAEATALRAAELTTHVTAKHLDLAKSSSLRGRAGLTALSDVIVTPLRQS